MRPAKGKAKAKRTASGKKVSYGKKGAKVKPGTKKGNSYCARSAGQMKNHQKIQTHRCGYPVSGGNVLALSRGRSNGDGRQALL